MHSLVCPRHPRTWSVLLTPSHLRCLCYYFLRLPCKESFLTDVLATNLAQICPQIGPLKYSFTASSSCRFCCCVAAIELPSSWGRKHRQAFCLCFWRFGEICSQFVCLFVCHFVLVFVHRFFVVPSEAGSAFQSFVFLAETRFFSVCSWFTPRFGFVGKRISRGTTELERIPCSLGFLSCTKVAGIAASAQELCRFARFRRPEDSLRLSTAASPLNTRVVGCKGMVFPGARVLFRDAETCFPS